jgi:hypothetical protein
MVDSMSDPDCRQGLAKPGIFTKTVLTYVETWGKPGEESFGFGLPNRIAYRIGKRTQGYTDLFPLEWRVRDLASGADAAPGPEPADGLRVVEADRLDPRVDALWESMQDRHPIHVVRDAVYLDWRYFRNPDVRYRVFLVERDGRLVGVAVGAERFIGEPTFAIAEWMLADGEERAGRHLLAACERAASEGGHTRILGSFLPRGCEEDRVFEAAGYALEKSTWTWVGRIYDPDALDWERLRAGFYLTLGDSDLV